MSATVLKPRAPAALSPYFLIAGLWLLTIFLVPPRGNFPLNDDWMYAKVVQHLVETGEYQPSPYIDPTFILQAYWGAAFVKLLGFSFETLRASTLVLALVALWAAHWCAREAGLNARWATLVAATLLVNPIFVNLSYVFMTDVPFLALSLLGGAAFLRAFRTERIRWVLIATLIVSASYFIRQFAVVMMAAAALTLLHPAHKSNKFRWQAVATFVGALAIFALIRGIVPTGGLGLGGDWDWSRLGTNWTERLTTILRHLAVAFCYLSLFLAPIAGAWLAAKVAARRKPDNREQFFHARSAISVFALALVSAWLVTSDWPYRLPGLGNVLIDLGVGPLLMPGMLDGTTIMAGARLGAWPWRVITGLALLGAGAIAALVIRGHLRALMPAALREPERRTDFFLALWAFGMLLMLIMPPVAARFDRYFLIAHVPLAILAVRWFAPRASAPHITAYVAAAVLYAFSLAGIQDYLAWNAARWTALAKLQHDGIPNEQINGGYEFNGWFLSDPFAEESRRTGEKQFGPLGWWTVKDDYRVSLRKAKRFEVIGTVPYFSWMGFTHRDMLILHRTEPDPELNLKR